MSNLTRTPLWSDIVDSSVWGQPNHVRILWIAMLAMKDRCGLVSASVSGLARRAVLSNAEVEDGLRILAAPDPESKTKDHEGRRIEAVEGGWLILNHEAMIKRMAKERDRAMRNSRQMRYREKKERCGPTLEERIACGELSVDKLDQNAVD